MRHVADHRHIPERDDIEPLESGSAVCHCRTTAAGGRHRATEDEHSGRHRASDDGLGRHRPEDGAGRRRLQACELSVWPTAQQTGPVQRRGRYVPESGKHPARMLPAIATQAINAFTEPGDLVFDPMCGIGTTIVEAMHAGRDGMGIEYESRWADLADANITFAHDQGATGRGAVIRGRLPRLQGLPVIPVPPAGHQ